MAYTMVPAGYGTFSVDVSSLSELLFWAEGAIP
jgi:hypothetical protein